MAIKGYKSPLENKDLWSLNKDDSSELVVPKLLKEWEVEKAKVQRYAEAECCLCKVDVFDQQPVLWIQIASRYSLPHFLVLKSKILLIGSTVNPSNTVVHLIF